LRQQACARRYRREHVGFVFQFYNLIPSLTAFENVALVAEIAAKPLDPRQALMLGLEKRLDHFPSQLSGGEQQRAISLAPGTDPKPVIAELDRLLEPYGLVGAVERRDQPSNRFLQDELKQQKLMSITIPFIFFGISAFLLNVALGRMVASQREQIATLKALGFPTVRLVMHYMKLVAIIVLAGSALGIVAGFGFGSAMIESYHGFFRLPDLVFKLTPWSIVAGSAISLVAASLGTA
jgi:putative ABC transport system permease protein